MAASPGDTVSIKPGVYVGQVSLRSGTKLIGEGMDTVTIRTAPSDKVLICAGVKDVFISNLTVEHDGKTAPDNKARNCALYIAGSTAVEVNHCRVENADGHGIQIEDCSPKITDCVVHRNYSAAASKYPARIPSRPSLTIIAMTTALMAFPAGARRQRHHRGEPVQFEQLPGRMAFSPADWAKEMVLRSNQCHDNQLSGSLLSPSSGFWTGPPTARAILCNQNHAAGITIMGARTAPTLKGNQCHNNRTSGIMFQRNSSGSGGWQSGVSPILAAAFRSWLPPPR